MNWSIDFAPFFSWTVLALLCIPALFLAAALVFSGLRGSVLRVCAIGALLLALLNPVVLREQRDPLKSVVALVVDRSQSQTIGERTAQTDEAVAELRQRLSAFPQFEVREVDARSEGTNDVSTALFGALRSALSDVSPGRVGGAIMVTDGQVHDIPPNAGALGFDAPLHALITGRPNEFDRRLDIVTAPRFGLVSQPQTLTYRVVEEGPRASRNPVEVQVFLNGDLVQRQSAVPGELTSVEITLPRAGKNIVELSAARDPQEITPVNNRAIAIIDGIRENLRVLLVSGEPHAGERTWRNLLKSDAALISFISQFCARRKSRTERRSTNCR